MPWEKKFDVDEALRLAMEAFWRRGYEATSMQDLVNETGVNRASLYATYGDKRALFLAALKAYDEKVRCRLTRELADRFEPVEAIRRLFAAFGGQLDQAGGNWGCLLTNTALELAAHDQEICEIVAAAQMDLELFIREQIGRGQRSGTIPPALDPQEAASGLLASLLGLLVLIRSRPDKALVSAIVEDAVKRIS
jgi:TetR/AcrR family transcriptional repressor of nem operon